MTLTVDDIPSELIKKYSDRKCGFFVGAGLSKAAGFPDWHGLLTGLIDRAENKRLLIHDKAEECRELAKDTSKFLMLAEEMKEVLGAEFKTYLEEIFASDKILPTVTHNLLAILKLNNFIITTNYDLLFERAFADNRNLQIGYKYYEANAVQRDLFLRSFFLLKAHGDAKTAAEHIILTEKDYRRLLYQQPGYQSVLQVIFTMYSVIFVGCSLQDPELKLLLNYINTAFPEGGTQHYALMSTETTVETERSRWNKDYNMQIIKISPDNDYEDIETFLTILRDIETEVESQS